MESQGSGHFRRESAARMRASRHPRRRATVGVRRPRRNRKPTAYRVEVCSSSASASSMSPATSEPVARRPWTSSLTERWRVFMQGACHEVSVGEPESRAAERRNCRRAIRLIAAARSGRGRYCNPRCSPLSWIELADEGSARESASRGEAGTCAKGEEG